MSTSKNHSVPDQDRDNTSEASELKRSAEQAQATDNDDLSRQDKHHQNYQKSSVSAIPLSLDGMSDAIIAVRSTIAAIASSESLRALVFGPEGSGRKAVVADIHRRSALASLPLHYIDAHQCSAVDVDAFLIENGIAPDEDSLASLYHSKHTDLRPLVVVSGLERLTPAQQWRIACHLTKPVADRKINSLSRAFAGIMGCDITQAIADGRLHSGLHEALSTGFISVPALVARGDDALYLARRVVAALNSDSGASKQMSAELESRIGNYSWPGNVAELRHTIHELYHQTANGSDIEPNTLIAPRLLSASDATIEKLVGSSYWTVQKLLIQETLASVGGDKRRAASLLGISLKTLYNRLRDFDL